MAEQILGLFCDPPIVIARLGGSTTPLDCCVWEEPPNPRSDGATVLVPDWSLNGPGNRKPPAARRVSPFSYGVPGPCASSSLPNH